MFTIRPIQPADYPAVQAIYQQGIDSGNASFLAAAPDWADWHASKLPDCRLLASRDNQIVGWAALTGEASHPFFYGMAEVSLYIANAAQGQGAGTALLQALIECSEKHGYWTLTAGIFPENSASLRLHQKLGFRVIGHREKPAQMPDGQWRDVVLLERRSQVVGIQAR